jgi:hypothetical protein
VKNGDEALDGGGEWDEDVLERHDLLGRPAEMDASLAGGLMLVHLVRMWESVEQMWVMER